MPKSDHYSKEHVIEDRTYAVEYHPDQTDGHYDDEDQWVRGHDAGVSIIWSCGDTVGYWDVEEFEQLLKNIGKGTKEHPYRADLSHGNYLVYYDKDEDTVMFTDVISTQYDERGPSLKELKKGLRGIKAKLKQPVTDSVAPLAG